MSGSGSRRAGAGRMVGSEVTDEGGARVTRDRVWTVAAPVRTGLALAAATMVLGGVAVFATPPAVVHSQQCVTAGEALAPVPWHQLLLKPDRAWPLSTGEGQRVAVVATGVAENPHLAGVVAGRTDVSPPVEFGEPSGEIDCVGIGTGVAGVIAGKPLPGVGFHGVAPDAEILDAKVVADRFPNSGDTTEAVAPGRLARGIDWAVRRDATVIVVATVALRDSEELREAVREATEQGIVVVAAVGEQPQGEQPDTVEPYPAAYEAVIGVGALDVDGTAGKSRPGHIGLVAPGNDVVTTYPGEGLGPASGSAYAAGLVGASAALVRAQHPELAPEEVAQRLFATAAPAPERVGSPRYGYGIVNPYQAMTDRLVPDQPEDPPPYQPVVVSDEELRRQADRERGDALAGRLALTGLAAGGILVALVMGVSRGRRRGWRAGLARMPQEPAAGDQPEPPRNLLDALPQAEDRRT